MNLDLDRRGFLLGGSMLVAASGMEMKPPLFVEVGAGGTDAEARRVEISKL